MGLSCSFGERDWKRREKTKHTSALPLDAILDAADAVSEAGLCGAQALVGCAEVLEFLGEALLEGGELLRRKGGEVKGVWR